MRSLSSNPPILQATSRREAVIALDHFQVGDQGKITGIQAEIELRHRLAAMGLREGGVVQVLRKASMRGPIHVRVGTTEVIMRRIDAQRITVVPLLELMAAP